MTKQVDTEAYSIEHRGNYPGQAWAVVLPRTTDEVSAVVRTCAEHCVRLIPQGGNTGLVGGSTPDDSGHEIVLSLKRMNRIRNISPFDNAMTVEAGCILQSVQEAAAAQNRMFPLTLGSEGSATIGGNLSTNAGGDQVVRYGNTREQVLGLEVVLADGSVLNGLSSLRKDNTGYDLKHLFIGGEGTLGIITAATLKLYPVPRQQATAWVALQSPDKAVALLAALGEELGDRVTAFEIMARETVNLVLTHFPQMREPLPTAAPWVVLVEVSEASRSVPVREEFEAALVQAIETDCILDVALAASGQQRQAMWNIRSHIPEAQRKDGPSLKHDISVPISRISEFIETVVPRMQAIVPSIRCITFGHVGDGNLHFNQSKPKEMAKEEFLAAATAIHEVVHETAAAIGGSISAEHGIGRQKQDILLRYKDPVAIQMMYCIKNALDPNNIFNPGRVLPLRQSL
ncbi:FAD-binding oxidoreductase [Pusillimonas sp. MFBS29]|uniref:FAD-binding oxidoreductase n=1 Tax=Pusillimonas sp. MFBS29 TaxID=2886690 RepID=UPI001D124BF9|nr:FAD-binding oxidoreductase [Pusillimonas sp. MFBS29]MCC2595876.1 FAD-binding oxidoreductase [Pusillimonas sp. MFBS29]